MDAMQLGAIPRNRQELEVRAPLRQARVLDVVPVGTAATDLVTALEFQDFEVQKMWVSNITGSARTCSAYIVPNGGAAGTGNAVFVGLNIPANSILQVEALEGYRIGPLDKIQLIASAASSLNAGLWGFDIAGEYN